VQSLIKRWKLQRTWPLHLLLLPAVVLVFIFQIIPMAGISIAFQNYNPRLGFFRSPFVGLAHFRYMFSFPDTWKIFRNTIVISVLKIVSLQLCSIFFALMLSEIINKRFRNYVQTVTIFPYFLSWIVLGNLFVDLLSTKYGAINTILHYVGIRPIYFLGNPGWFLVVLVVSNIWKDIGYVSVIYLAAIAGVDFNLHEAGTIDGANRMQRIVHITLPSIMPIIVLQICLSIGGILNAGFDQIFNLYNPLVYDIADIVDTFVYRVGLLNAQFSFGTAVGLLRSVIATLLILTSFKLADKLANYQVF
jgi:putative aldouronate transport system permease protein